MTPLASTVTLLFPSRPPPCFLAWHLDTAAAALHVLPRSLCCSPSARVVPHRSAGFSRLPARISRLVSFSLSSLFLTPPPSTSSSHAASPSFSDISSLLLGRALPQRRAPLRINTSSGIRQRGHTAALQTDCVWSHMRSAPLRFLCVCL